MKRLLVAVVMTGILGGVMATGALAQTSGATKPRETWSSTQQLHDSRDIIGVRLKNAQGKDLGEIDALMIDPKDGKITHAVVGVGGLAGLGEKHLIVPWSELKSSMDHNRVVLTMDQATLERAPRYERKAVAGRDRPTPSASPSTAPADSPKTDKTDTKTDTKK